MFTAQQGSYNVEPSFNIWFRNNITGQLPGWVDTAYFNSSGVNFNYPEKQLTYPCYSVTHLSTISQPLTPTVGIGGSALDMKYMMVDLSCWSSRIGTAGKDNPSVVRDIRQLRDAAVNIMMSGKNYIPILDYYNEGLTASTVLGSLRLRSIEEPPTPTDPNTTVRRKRLMVTFNFQSLWRPY